MDQDEGISFDRRDREILRLIYGGWDAKAIAGALEIAISTVHGRISQMCEKAKVNRTSLVIWVLQNPEALFPDSVSYPGLHIPPCTCGSPYCLGEIAIRLRAA